MNLGLLLSLIAASTFAPALTNDITRRSLATAVENPAPWLKIESGSDQRSPVYAGATPYEMASGKHYETPMLPESMGKLAGKQAGFLLGKLKLDQAEFEVWPAQDDEGQRTWVFARYRTGESSEWEWLDAGKLGISASEEPKAITTTSYNAWVKADSDRIFIDFLELESLYDKPLFGECLWTDEAGEKAFAGWIAPTPKNLKYYREQLTKPGKRFVCRWMPQPARFNDLAVTFRLKADKKSAHFVEEIEWVSDARPAPQALHGEKLIKDWGKDFESAYAQDVRVLAGEKTAIFPKSGRKAVFTRKNSADAKNQLLDVVKYLEERYAALGIKTQRQEFTWRDIPQANLAAFIPGSLPPEQNRPILLGDHIDTAFSEDEYRETRKRLSAPGADDNASATAALLRAAEIFVKGKKPRHDIVLVHFTGEEFPGDCLGARQFVSRLLQKKAPIGGLILMDMIAYRNPKADPIFQINVGETKASFVMGEYLLGAAGDVAPQLEPRFQMRFDPRSYLYNTDGIIFSDSGFPVVLLNEHINKLENFERSHYHERSDTSDKLDWGYATAIVKTAIEGAARMSGFRLSK